MTAGEPESPLHCFEPAELLQCARPFAPAQLVPAQAFLRARELAGRIPPAVCVAAFECRLDGDDDRVDYSFCIRATPAALSAVLAFDPSPAAAVGPWSELAQELRRWADASRRTGSPAVWIEVDATPGGELAPFLVHTLRELSDDDPLIRIRETRSAVSAALALAHGDELLDGLDALVERLPPWAAVRHVALRPARRDRLLRVICRMSTSEASAFAPGGRTSAAGRAMNGLFSEVLPLPVVTNVNLDVTPSLGSRVGIEYGFEADPAEDPRSARLLHALQRRGLAGSWVPSALLDWPSSRKQPAGRDDGLVRDLLVKVDYGEAGSLQAKAYLPFTTPGALRSLQAPGIHTAA